AYLKSSAALWVGIFVPPLAWAADETISYAATKWACGHQAGIVLHALTLATLGAIAAAATISWSADCENERARFMSVLGLMLSALDDLAERLFSAHMAQHELLMVVAAPLIALASPLVALMWMLPARGRRAVARAVRGRRLAAAWAATTAPALVWSLHAVALWV